MADTPSPGTAADVKRWAENRRIANVLEVRELATTWGVPARSIAAAIELSALWESLHGWPPPPSPVDRRDDLVVWDRFARLRQPYVR
jgi:hypothetical protein